MNINHVTISGNLTRDPELRMTAGGTQVLSFGVAVNDRRRNPQTGEWEEYPNFIDCTMFGLSLIHISLRPRRSSSNESSSAIVVLPTPPFWFATRIVNIPIFLSFAFF